MGTWNHLRPDFLEMVGVVTSLKEAFPIEIRDEEAEIFRPVEDAIDSIERRKKGGNPN